MNTFPYPDIGGAAVLQSLQGALASAIRLQLYSNGLIETPKITLPKVVESAKDLGTHMDAVRADALDYLKNINPLLAGTTSAHVIGFTNLWDAMYDKLVAAIRSGQWQHVDEGLVVLQTKVRHEADIAELTKLLACFVSKVQTDDGLLVADLQAVDKSLSTDISALKVTIAGITKALADDNKVISEGASKQAIGVALIVVALLAAIGKSQGGGEEPPDTENEQELIKLSIDMIGAAAEAEKKAMADVKVKMKEYATTITDLSVDEMAYTVVEASAANVNGLSAAASAAAKAVSVYEASWLAIEANLQALIDALKSGAKADQTKFEAMFVAANKTWSEAKTQAIGWQESDTIAVKKVKEA